MLRLDVQHEGWDHGHFLLPGDASDVVLAFEEVVDLRQQGHLADLVPGAIDVPCQIVGIPRDGPRGLHGISIQFQGPLGLQACHQLLLQLLLEVGCVLPAPVDSKRGRQALPQAFQERVPFVRRDHALLLVVFFEGSVGEWESFPTRPFRTIVVFLLPSVVTSFEPPRLLRIPHVWLRSTTTTLPRTCALLAASHACPLGSWRRCPAAAKLKWCEALSCVAESHFLPEALVEDASSTCEDVAFMSCETFASWCEWQTTNRADVRPYDDRKTCWGRGRGPGNTAGTRHTCWHAGCWHGQSKEW
mmetsp:Transcript_1945/g.12239  ORF Transcript_1945/g.12239 Transcript_1945/m.12239 type:complete len:302 (-) Transcript_1945:167-1072(-)